MARPLILAAVEENKESLLFSNAPLDSIRAVLSLSYNPDGRECDIVSFNKDGSRDSEISTGKKIISLDMRGNERAILCPDSIIVYDREGSVKGTSAADTDARKIVYCDYNTFYVLGKSRISRLYAE